MATKKTTEEVKETNPVKVQVEKPVEKETPKRNITFLGV